MASLRVTFWAACLVQALTYVSSNTSDFHPHAPSDRNDGPDEQARSTCSDERCELVLAVATSLNKLSSFVAANAAVANDDLFFTLRMAQGQLYQLRRDAPHIYAAGEVADLLTAADEDLASAALVLQENFKSSEHLGPEFQNLMDSERGRRIERINTSCIISDFQEEWERAFQENLVRAGGVMQFCARSSDLCLGQLSPLNVTSNGATANGRSTYCAITGPCWLMMTKPCATDYYITHQVMFLALGGTCGCSPDFEAHAQRYFGNRLQLDSECSITHEIIRHQCKRVFEEAARYFSLDVPDTKKDLFLEEGFLCGASVYMPEFFNFKWIRAVLSWQKPSGCFGFFDNIEYHQANYRSDRVNLKAVEKRSLPDDGQNSIKVAKNVGPSPRREKPITEDCYSHNTGVALGYLSVALRYLTD